LKKLAQIALSRRRGVCSDFSLKRGVCSGGSSKKVAFVRIFFQNQVSHILSQKTNCFLTERGVCSGYPLLPVHNNIDKIFERNIHES